MSNFYKKLSAFISIFIFNTSIGHAYSSFDPATGILTIPVLTSKLINGQTLHYRAQFKRIQNQYNLISLTPLPANQITTADANFDQKSQTLTIPRINLGNTPYSAQLKWPTLFSLQLVNLTQINPASNSSATQQPSRSPSNTTDPSSNKTPASSISQIPELVYVRVPRTNGSYPIKGNDGKTYTLTNADLWDSLPEVSRTIGGFNAFGQLVHRLPDGTETILYDCTGRPCTPTEPSVSLDGTKVLFSVVTAKNIAAPWGVRDLPNELLGTPLDATLYIYDLTTDTLSQLPHTPGVFDISPIWLPDGNIMFASNRAKIMRPWLHWITPTSKAKQFQLYIADSTGNNARNISPHELAGAISPYLLNNGRIAYSSLWLSHNLAYIGTNGSINWPTTMDNMWVVMDMDYQGGDTTALLGAHRHNIKTSRGRTKTMKALHFIGQRRNNDICTANYYRANNMGLGDIFCWPQQPKGIEGELPTFLPKGVYNVADWSKSNDEGSFTYAQLHIGDQSQRFIGKIGFPEGSPDGQLIITAGFGRCSQIALDLSTALRLSQQTGCDVGLYKTTTIPSKHPNDLIKIVDNPNWHEFNARVIQPRHITVPTINTTQDGSCQLISTDAGTAETHPHRRYKFNHNYFNAANNGSEIDGLPHSELAGIRFYEVLPNTEKKQTFKNSIGNRLKFITDVPLLADNSFKVELPCNTPYIMAGIDIEGRIIKRDQIPQSLRPGEKRVCTGCHLHNKVGRPYEQSLAFNAAPVIGTTSSPVPTYEKDIKPILINRCASCHSNDVPLFDYNKLVLDFFQKFVPQNKKLVVNKSTTNPKARYGLQRPQWSKYVNTMYARESLLYWKAANKRTDGRTDATYPNDIDFGANHPTNITPDELRMIAEWLDSGANRN